MLKKIFPSVLSSKMVLNWSKTLEFFSLGIHTPSAYLHWSTGSDSSSRPNNSQDLPQLLAEARAAFVFTVWNFTRPWGRGCSCCLNNFLDLSPTWFLDVKFCSWGSWAYQGIVVAKFLVACWVSQGVVKEGVNILYGALEVAAPLATKQLPGKAEWIGNKGCPYLGPSATPLCRSSGVSSL